MKDEDRLLPGVRSREPTRPQPEARQDRECQVGIHELRDCGAVSVSSTYREVDLIAVEIGRLPCGLVEEFVELRCDHRGSVRRSDASRPLRQSSRLPMVRFTVVTVIPLAMSDAMKAASSPKLDEGRKPLRICPRSRCPSRPPRPGLGWAGEEDPRLFSAIESAAVVNPLRAIRLAWKR